MRVTGSQLVAEILLEHDVDTVFGYPGGAALNIYDALYEYRDKIRHILTAHEQGAAHAADGYYRATGKTGVVFATSGPWSDQSGNWYRHSLYGQHTDGCHNGQTFLTTSSAEMRSRKSASQGSLCR